MTGKRGRKPISEVERLQQAQTARRVVDEELAAMRSAGLMPSEGKAKANAARRLGVSARKLGRLLALVPAADHRKKRIGVPRGFIAQWEATRKEALRDRLFEIIRLGKEALRRVQQGT